MARLALVIHNVRSAHNVGSLLRSAEGLGVAEVFLCGYTPYPAAPNDSRLPHQIKKISQQIHKTALGAEDLVCWQQRPQIGKCLGDLKKAGYLIVALEQGRLAANLADLNAAKDKALIVGNELSGLEATVLKMADVQVQIPMLGGKESFNVAVAGAMALYHLSYLDKNST